MNNENKQNELNDSKPDNLLNLIKESIELSKMSAMVNFAYCKAKSKEQISNKCSEFSNMIETKIKKVVGNVKENSELYDKIENQKAELHQNYQEMINGINEKYEESIKDLIAKKTEIEVENATLTASSEQIRLERQEKKEKYDLVVKKESQIAKSIEEKKIKAQKLAEEGKVKSAIDAIEEYKKMKNELLMDSTDSMLEYAISSQMLRDNKEKFEENLKKIAEITEKIEKMQSEKEAKISEVEVGYSKDLVKVNEQNSVFKRLAIFASKTVTKIFNKGKAVEEEVFIPTMKKIEDKSKEFAVNVKSNAINVVNKSKETIQEKIEKAINTGKNIRENAIDKLKSRNDKVNEKMEQKKKYIESSRKDVVNKEENEEKDNEEEMEK